MEKKIIKKKDKLKMLVAIVNRGEGDQIIEFGKKYDMTLQLVLLGKGTANSELLNTIGLDETEKDVVIGIIKESLAAKMLETIQKVLDIELIGKGIVFTINMTSVIGPLAYDFLSANTKEDK